MNIHLLITVTWILLSGTVYAQSDLTTTGQAETFPNKKFPAIADSTKIKWTWQLPSMVKSSFNKTQYAAWFVEQIVGYNSKGKTIYSFNLDNGNLLDGDHHDSFLKTVSLNISDDGTILRK